RRGGLGFRARAPRCSGQPRRRRSAPAQWAWFIAPWFRPLCGKRRKCASVRAFYLSAGARTACTLSRLALCPTPFQFARSRTRVDTDDSDALFTNAILATIRERPDLATGRP